MVLELSSICVGSKKTRFSTIHASDFFVAPYDDIVSSGSVILEMSFWRPVIAPKLGCIPELVSNESGILYESDIENGLKHALLTSLEQDVEQMSGHALEVAMGMRWEETARVTSLAYTSSA